MRVCPVCEPDNPAARERDACADHDPRKYDHCGCGGGCCQTLAYLMSLWTMMFNDGPSVVGEAQYTFACAMLDEAGK